MDFSPTSPINRNSVIPNAVRNLYLGFAFAPRSGEKGGEAWPVLLGLGAVVLGQKYGRGKLLWGVSERVVSGILRTLKAAQRIWG